MGNHTVNDEKKEVKNKEYIQGAATQNDVTSITIMMVHPELLQVISDKALRKTPAVEFGDMLYQTDSYVAYRVEDNRQPTVDKKTPKTKIKPEAEHEI